LFMQKLFSPMYDHPKTELIITGYIYWFLCYVFVPFGMVMFTIGLTENASVIRAWMEIGYHAVNGLAAVCIMRRYLVDSFYNVSSQTKLFAKTSLFSCMMMVIAAVLEYIMLTINGKSGDIFQAFPIVDQNLFLLTDTTMSVLPVPATLCMTLFTPITVCCLFYAICFAPTACRRPLFGYASVVILFIAFHGYEYIWHLDMQKAASIFLLRLPVHLIACRAYQKSNTVWTPIVSLSAFNLLTSLAYMLF